MSDGKEPSSDAEIEALSDVEIVNESLSDAEQEIEMEPSVSSKPELAGFVIGRKFNSFDEVVGLLDTLKSANHPVRVFNSQSVNEYNKRRAKAKIPLAPVDKKWKYTYYSVRCVHYGQGRYRSKGVRPNQRHLALSCPAKVTISYDRVAGCLVLRECQLQHNHRIGSAVMEQYPSSRRLGLDERQSVNELLRLKPNNKQLKDHIHNKYKKLVTLRDIQNMKAKVKEVTKDGRRDEQILLDSLEDALTKDTNAKGGVSVTEDNVVAMVAFQSGQMTELFKKFPEILLVDGTYNVNRLGMPLYCFMVEDGFGNGRNVFYAATAEEDSTHLLHIIQSFKAFNPSWSDVRVIIIDKDFTELQALQQEFPQASVLFCQFHVIKCFFKQIVELDVPKENRDEARELIRRLVHAKSEDEYASIKQELFDATNDAFQKYFVKNWDSCKEMWATYLRDEHLHFANTTNNRLECHNQKIKDVTARSMSISEMFDNMLLFCRTNAAEYCHKSFVEEFSSCRSASDSIPGVMEITSSCTAYSAERIVEQLKLSQKVAYEVTQEREHGTFLVTYRDHKHHVSLPTHSCSCSFSKTMGLPCRHLFVVRAAQDLPAFELQLVANRWHKDYQLLIGSSDECDNGVEGGPAHVMPLSEITVNSRMTCTLSRNQKYKKTLDVGNKLAMVASECGMPDFRRKYDAIQSLLHYWEHNVEVEIVPLQDTENPMGQVRKLHIQCRRMLSKRK